MTDIAIRNPRQGAVFRTDGGEGADCGLTAGIDVLGPSWVSTAKVFLGAVDNGPQVLGGQGPERVLNPGENRFRKLDALQFPAYVEDDDFPKIISLLQCRTQSKSGLEGQGKHL